jgi:microsomal dipeptidase-like Zn-dependent dipeptidase
MEERFADLHCHPHLRSFNWLHKPEVPEKDSVANPWWIIHSKRSAEKKGSRAAAYSQCDMAKIINGNMKLAFVALYPLEKGWVTKKSLAVYGGSEDKGPNIRDFIQAIFMKIPMERLQFVQSTDYDYFHELKEEKTFLDKGNDKYSATRIKRGKNVITDKAEILQRFPREYAEGTYVIAKNGEDMVNIINENKVAFVLTIEGGNVFNTADLDVDSIIEKIREVKNWDEKILFISLTHHFYNHLAGHAHSIPNYAKLVLDQSNGINGGFTTLGIKVTRFLLGIDDEGNYKPGEFGYRILIDVKHLNAKSRREYYNTFVMPSLLTDHPIPVVASHVAYSGKDSLEVLIEDMAHERDNNLTERRGNRFNNWNINLCDEDVITICKSNGLIGINLDQRVLGVNHKYIKVTSKHGNYVWQHIKAMMQTVLESPVLSDDEKARIPGLFCLGTDFDGFIDPLNKYPTVLQFSALRKDLINLVEKDPDKTSLIGDMNVEEFVDKICFKNAYDFVVRNFR